ncbi:MAG: sarcosine oxidase subunit gamma [Jannaschia sp.]
MTDLAARAATADLLPLSHGTLTLSEEMPDAITSLVPLGGASDILPPPGRSITHADGGTLLWSGLGQAMLLGPVPEPVTDVATTDQTGAWAVLLLEGADVRDALARLTPLDLDPAIFAEGYTARSLLGHMNALFHRAGPDAFLILVFRSMAGSAVHEIEVAMRGVAARARAGS